MNQKKKPGLVVYFGADVIGKGNDALGRVLMDNLLNALARREGLTHLVFLNTGATLAIEDSPVLNRLEVLEKRGLKLLVCGTCLDFYDARTRLKVGRVSTMVEILEVLSEAERVLYP